MSSLTTLLRRIHALDPRLAKDVEEEVKALSRLRRFGLNFERHIPESVELPDRRIQRGDKVKIRPTRGTDDGDSRLWNVAALQGTGTGRVATLVEIESRQPETISRQVADLIAVAEFRDPIYPGLRPKGTIEQGKDKPFHVVINGENFHALEALLFSLRGKIDCIYIDPPYNSRAKDWKYNNDYVDPDDFFTHSKWLAMMERRLKVAEKLLNPEESVLIVTIDEKEYLWLGILLEQVFPGALIQMASSVISAKGTSRKRELSRVNEFIFYVFIGKAGVKRWVSNMLDGGGTEVSGAAVEWLQLRRRERTSTRTSRFRQFYPIFVNTADGSLHSIGDYLELDEPPESVAAPEGTKAFWPLAKDGREMVWGCRPEELRDRHKDGYFRVRNWNPKKQKVSLQYLQEGIIEGIESGRIEVLGYDTDGSVIAQHSADVKGAIPKTAWNLRSHNAEQYGTKVLTALIPGRKFDFPKSLYAVEDTIRLAVRDKKDAVILDYFAGSGTTAHAVMRLNRQDGGRRRSILITNNEVSAEEAERLQTEKLRPGDSDWEALGIYQYITRPRITAALTGITPDGGSVKGDYTFTDEFHMANGFEENVAFFDLTYEDPDLVRLNMAYPVIDPLLWMRAGSEGHLLETASRDYKIAEAYGVLFNVDASAEFVRSAKASASLRAVYVLTDDERQYQLIARELSEKVEVVRLYDSYWTMFSTTASST